LQYQQIAEKYPEDFQARDDDKYNYRYRGGESYRDVVIRLEPIIMELERSENIIIITYVYMPTVLPFRSLHSVHRLPQHRPSPFCLSPFSLLTSIPVGMALLQPPSHRALHLRVFHGNSTGKIALDGSATAHIDEAHSEGIRH